GFGNSQGSSTITFNALTATPSLWSNAKVIAPVPANATTGSVVVNVGGIASNGVTFTVASTGTVSGKVTRATDGVAIAAATVQLLQTGVALASANTATDGSYTISNLQPGLFDVQISATGY